MAQADEIKCSSCGASIAVTQKSSRVIACHYCGAVLDLKSEQLSIIDRLDSKEYEPKSFLRLGMIGTIDGVAYQIIGRICYASQIREWDSADRQYYSEPWNFESWVLVNENKEFIYIQEDSEGFSVSKSFVPSAPKVPNFNDQYLSFHEGGDLRLILEHGRASIAHYEGEFSWTPQVGNIVCSAECGIDSDFDEKRRSVEWRLDPNSEGIKEIEFFNSRPMPLLELARAFDQKEILEAESLKVGKAQEMKKWSLAFFGASALMFLLMLFAFADGGKIIAQHEMNLSHAASEGSLYGPLEMKKVGGLYKLEVSTSIPDNSWSWGAVELLDSSKLPINSVQGDFWRESGYDSDGRWSERYTKTSKLFRLSKSGEYYLRLMGEKGTASKGTVFVKLKEGLTLARFYLFGMLFCLGYAVAMMYYKSINPLYMLIGLVAFVFLILSHMDED